MELRPFGKTGEKVSCLCLGTMQFLWPVTEPDAHNLLDFFFESGGNFLDTADMYSQWAPGLKGGESETVIGNWMKQRNNRAKVFLATKVRCRMWEGADGEGLGKAHILKACEDSLRRLQTDRIDLYQSHWSDDSVPIGETLSAYQTLVRQGKVRWIGCSNYSGKELEESFVQSDGLGIQYASIQPHYNLIRRKSFEKEVLPVVLKRGMAVIPYSPLAGGFLTGKYRKDKPLPEGVRADQIWKSRMTDENFKVIAALEKAAQKNGKTILQTALAWLLSHDWMTAPIIVANSIEQLKESLGAVGFRLPEEDRKELDRVSSSL